MARKYFYGCPKCISLFINHISSYTLLKVGRIFCIFQFWYAIHIKYSSSFFFFTKWLFGRWLDEQILMNQRSAELHIGRLISGWLLCSLCFISLGTFTLVFYCIKITFRSYLRKPLCTALLRLYNLMDLC